MPMIVYSLWRVLACAPDGMLGSSALIQKALKMDHNTETLYPHRVATLSANLQ